MCHHITRMKKLLLIRVGIEHKFERLIVLELAARVVGVVGVHLVEVATTQLCEIPGIRRIQPHMLIVVLRIRIDLIALALHQFAALNDLVGCGVGGDGPLVHGAVLSVVELVAVIC